MKDSKITKLGSPQVLAGIKLQSEDIGNAILYAPVIKVKLGQPRLPEGPGVLISRTFRENYQYAPKKNLFDPDIRTLRHGARVLPAQRELQAWRL